MCVYPCSPVSLCVSVCVPTRVLGFCVCACACVRVVLCVCLPAVCVCVCVCPEWQAFSALSALPVFFVGSVIKD